MIVALRARFGSAQPVVNFGEVASLSISRRLLGHLRKGGLVGYQFRDVHPQRCGENIKLMKLNRLPTTLDIGDGCPRQTDLGRELLLRKTLPPPLAS
jgi:hypothetical protein